MGFLYELMVSIILLSYQKNEAEPDSSLFRVVSSRAVSSDLASFLSPSLSLGRKPTEQDAPSLRSLVSFLLW